MDIRPYQRDDYEACRDLWRELTERHREIYGDPTIGGSDPGSAFDAHLKERDLAGLWVAVDDRSVVGMVGLLVHGGEGEVEPVVVTSSRRSAGIGRRLLARVVDEAQARSLERLSIRPVAKNVEAMKLFRQVGFERLGRVDMFMDFGRPERV